jgi:hypothetical protein
LWPNPGDLRNNLQDDAKTAVQRQNRGVGCLSEQQHFHFLVLKHVGQAGHCAFIAQLTIRRLHLTVFIERYV